MPKWIAYKDKQIKLISDSLFNSSEFSILKVPDNLENLSNNDLLLNYIIKDNQLVNKSDKIATNKLKLAIITNIYMRCGLSTYIEHLLDPLLKTIENYKIFAEENDLPTDIEKKWPITQCWKRGKPPLDLIKQIKEYSPDIILINHEWGLWGNSAHWLSLLTQLSEYRIIVILHSVFPDHKDKTISEAAISEIIVHSDSAKQALEKKGIKSKIHTIPHGCYSITNQSKLWNIYRTEHTFITSGFGFPYKNFSTSIGAVSLLKDKYPDIFFTLLFTESPFNKIGHQSYYEELMALIKKLNVQENVAIVRGYQTDEVIDAYYRTNTVAVFPYKSEPGHMVYGASGFIRLAASKGIPTISSNIPHFDQFPSIKINNESELATELDILFTNPEKRKEQVAKQNQYIKENNWENIAKKYLNILECNSI